MTQRHPKRRVVRWLAIWLIMLIVASGLLWITGIVYFGVAFGRDFTSQDWSGFVVSSSFISPQGYVTYMNGSWVVPQVMVTDQDTFCAIWIGIGGQYDSSLIQVGTEQNSIGGQAIYGAWYEMLPSSSVTIDIKISPGDQMYASIALVDSKTNQWQVHIADLTTGRDFGGNFTYDSFRLSAEWVIERPTVNNQLARLAQFNSINITGASATLNRVNGRINAFFYGRITMNNRQGTPLVAVSSLLGGQSGFKVTWLNSY